MSVTRILSQNRPARPGDFQNVATVTPSVYLLSFETEASERQSMIVLALHEQNYAVGPGAIAGRMCRRVIRRQDGKP